MSQQAEDALARAVDIFNQLSEQLSDEDGNVTDLSPAEVTAYVQAAAQIAIAQRLDLLRQAIIQTAVSKDPGAADKADA